MEYNGDAMVLYPKAALCSVDGIPISEPTRLPQGTSRVRSVKRVIVSDSVTV